MANALAFCGDFAVASGSVAERIVISKKIQPFAMLRSFLCGESFLVANLECAITDREGGTPFKWVNLKMSPNLAHTLEGLNLAVLGNDHAGDFGQVGVVDTEQVLAGRSIPHVGIGRNIDEAISAKFIELDTGRIGVVSLCCPTTNSEFIATHLSSGVAPLGMEILKKAVIAARRASDAVVVFLHWGREHVHDPAPDQLRLARHAIDCGANAVIGCHSHTIQSYEMYRDAWIFYGLGNFFFDPGEAQTIDPEGNRRKVTLTRLPENQESLVVVFSLAPDQSQPLQLESILPTRVTSGWALQAIADSELSFSVDEANAKLRKFVSRNQEFLRGRSEPSFRATIRNGVLAYWYEREDLFPHRKAFFHSGRTLAGAAVRRMRRFVRGI